MECLARFGVNEKMRCAAHTVLGNLQAYKEDVRESIAFIGLLDYMRLRSVGRSHIISWRKDMERCGLAPASIRRKLSALSSLFDYLCERVKGKRSKIRFVPVNPAAQRMIEDYLALTGAMSKGLFSGW